MGTSHELYIKIREWIHFVLVNEGGCTQLQIIQEYQNAPAPLALPYITVEGFGNSNKIGRADKQYPPDDDGNTKVLTNYELLLNIREVGGTGDLLRDLISSEERSEIVTEFFTKQNISNMGTGPIQSIPILKNNEWEQQSLFEIKIAFTDVTIEKSSWIETVGWTENLGGKQNE